MIGLTWRKVKNRVCCLVVSQHAPEIIILDPYQPPHTLVCPLELARPSRHNERSTQRSD